MKQNDSSTGIGFLGLLAISFIVLKLCNVITWPWWIVLLPCEIPAAIVIICVVIMVLYIRYKDRKRMR